MREIDENVGIGGSYSKQLKIGEIVHFREEVFSELGATEGNGNFLQLEALGFHVLCVFLDDLVGRVFSHALPRIPSHLVVGILVGLVEVFDGLVKGSCSSPYEEGVAPA